MAAHPLHRDLVPPPVVQVAVVLGAELHLLGTVRPIVQVKSQVTVL